MHKSEDTYFSKTKYHLRNTEKWKHKADYSRFYEKQEIDFINRSGLFFFSYQQDDPLGEKQLAKFAVAEASLTFFLTIT